jgi:chemotaxis family two-component system sensor kinase Cph1
MANGPFGNCKTAVLHKIDKIQSYGCLLVIDKQTQLLLACSDNCKSLLNKTSEQLLGQDWREALPGVKLTLLSPNSDATDSTISRVMEIELEHKTLTLAHHSVDNYCIVEIEPVTETMPATAHHIKVDYIQKLSKLTTAKECASLLMHKVAELIGFDRVLLYKFLPDWHGEVIDEVLQPKMKGFLGLKFPASDVPANARRMYTLNQQRLIANVTAPTSSIVWNKDDIDLDLTWSQLRAVHPVHIQYLKNLAVEASFSVSLVCNGELWGLLACHHLSAKHIPFSVRQACEELSQLNSLHMAGLLRSETDLHRYNYRSQFSAINGALQGCVDAYKAINSNIEELKQLLNADGIWHHLDGSDYYNGQVPDDLSMSLLGNWLAQFDRHQVMARHTIAEDFKNKKSIVKFASGLLFIPLNQQNFIVFLRQEEVETVNWAGKPQSADEGDMSTSALTPRNSFQTWAEVVKGHAKPWQLMDIETAELIRAELMAFIEKNQLETLALKDPLTGIANRIMFERKIKMALQHTLEEDRQFAVYMIDLDKFKPVNDTYGHAAGDELLIQVSQRLTHILRHEDLVARLGGDEFAVIQMGIAGKNDIERVAGLMITEMQRPFIIGEHTIEIGASIGITLCPLDAVNQPDLLLGADLALYEVKKGGRNGYKQFERSMLRDKDSEENMRDKLIKAFDNQEFEMVYQPIIDNRSKQTVCLEAFCRWNHPVLGLLVARDFVDNIDKHHLNPTFVYWGFDKVFYTYQQWQRQGIASIPVSINLRSDQFLSLDIEAICRELSNKYQVATSWLRIDLDEPALAIDASRSEEKINALSQMGILCNIDHFGQGLLSLQQLTKLKVNTLKIDGRLFLDDLNSPKTDSLLTILKAISEVMNVPVIVTKVESDEMINRAIKSGFHLLQGLVIHAPFAASELDEYLEKNS